MDLIRDLIKKAIDTRDGNILKEVSSIQFPDVNYKKYVIMEYDGDVPRLFGDKRSIELLIPSNMDIITENAVVDAIESGALFDDKKEIENKVDYITMTHLPKLGMMHRHIDEPKSLIHAIGSVVGAMNQDGHFGSSDSDIKNGKNYTMDLTEHGNEKDTSVLDLTSDYLDIKDKEGKGCPIELRRALVKVPDEIEDIKKVKPEDTVDEDDYEEIGLDHEDEDDEEDTCDKCDDDEDCEEDDKQQKKSSSRKKDEDDEEESSDNDDDDEEDDEDIDVEKEEAIESFLKKRKKDIDFKNESVFRGYPKKGDPEQVSFQKETASSYQKSPMQKVSEKLSSVTSSKPQEPSSYEMTNNSVSYEKADIKTEYHRIREYDEYELYQETNAILVKPKKLKPIGRDVVAYIMTQKNSIEDSNDQAMVASYCCAKLELVDFYLNCIDTKDYRYIVPHNRQYLVQMQNDLNRCLQEILRVRPINRMDRAWKVNVVYPNGYGG